jgi:hypothetical protein
MNARHHDQVGDRVLAFFGSDVRSVPRAALAGRHAQGEILLALDTAAMKRCADAAVPYTVVEDWVEPDRIQAAKEEAVACEHGWFGSAREAFTRDGICWPEVDHHAMRWFWREVAVGTGLAEALEGHGLRELTFVQRVPPRPAVYDLTPTDVCGSLWCHLLPDIARPVGSLTEVDRDGESTASPRSGRGRVRREIRRMLRRGWRIGHAAASWWIRSGASEDDLAGRVVVAFNAGEYYRLTPIVRHLAARLPRGVAGVSHDDDHAAASKVAREWGVPVVTGPSRREADPAFCTRLQEAFGLARNGAGDEPWAAVLDALGFHFDYYGTERWPMLARGYDHWASLWGRTRPRAVLVTTLQDSESQLPALAAKRLGIPTLALPHGALQGDDLRDLSSEYILYGLGVQGSVHEAFGVEARRLVPCRGVLQANEYPVVPAPPARSAKARRVLVLTNPIGFDGTLYPHLSVKAQVEGLRALGAPPADLAGRIEVRIKPNPQYPDRALLEAAGPATVSATVPANADLHDLLGDAALVVALDYYGSALVHVIRARIPVVFFWPDPSIGSSTNRPHETVCLPAGRLLRDEAELWDTIRSFLDRPEFARELGERVADFADEQFDDGAHPDVADVLDRLATPESRPPAGGQRGAGEGWVSRLRAPTQGDEPDNVGEAPATP